MVMEMAHQRLLVVLLQRETDNLPSMQHNPLIPCRIPAQMHGARLGFGRLGQVMAGLDLTILDSAHLVGRTSL